MIILIRHAQSEGNKNREIHQLIPDHRVKLTDEGWVQVMLSSMITKTNTALPQKQSLTNHLRQKTPATASAPS
jgi:phosphohistidine phosphatase SixA